MGLLLLGIFAYATQHINPAAPVMLVWIAMFIVLVGFAIAALHLALSSGEWLASWRRSCPSTAPRSLIFHW